MKKLNKHVLMIIFSIASIVAAFPVTAGATAYCGRGAATPPFLGGGVDPNLLLMIDNSASMLDLAYVDETDTCYDDSYSNTYTYAGYFDSDTWYAYDFTNNKFIAKTASEATTFCNAAATEYSSAYVCVDGTITATSGNDELTAVSAFYAKGNLLNWVSASKIDIQKEILTGGNYDSTNQWLKMESRGCGDRRFVKKVSVTYNTTDTHYVTLAVRPPRATVYDAWENDTVYAAGAIVSNAGGDLYKTTAGGTSSGSSPLDDTGVTWTAYWATRWHDGVTYSVGDLVTDPSKDNTVDDGRVYIATVVNGAASGTGVDDDANITWETYDLTNIEIFAGNDTGFDNTDCQDAIDELNSSNPALGTLMNEIDDCMGTQRYAGGSGSADANNAFNKGIQQCWWKVKHGTWQPGSGPETSMKNDCEAIYNSGIDPWELTPDDRAYVCYGQNDGDPVNDKTDDKGYVGRCWLPGSSPLGGSYTGTWRCTKTTDTYPVDCPDANKQEYVYLDGSGNEPPDYSKNTAYAIGDIVLDRNGDPWQAQTAGTAQANFLADDSAAGGGVDWAVYGTPAGWTTTDEGYGDWPTADTNGDGKVDENDTTGDGTLDRDDCIRWAMADFCGGMEVPEVIDPSDQIGADTGDTDVTWGLPAILTDGGVVAQLEEPIAVMKGFIAKSTQPTGLIQKYDDDIRMGAMVFNNSGSDSECDSSDPFVLYDCTDANNKDGGYVISEIDQSSSHTTSLVSAINGVKANSWTPLAEAYYNAIGYYKQDTGMRLNATDFNTTTNPVEYWCQNNNILIITEGASTADRNTTVSAFVAASGQNDADTDDFTSGALNDCGTLDGSTLLDDLTDYVHDTEGVLGTQDGENKRNIDTHIVVAGTARDTGDTECSPNDLLTEAATNGGTTLVSASNPEELEEALDDAFSSIRAGAAAGSAASVISASRGGEGAAYQAIFWAELEDSGSHIVDWVGEVHALLVDSLGNLYEDTNNNRTLDSTDERVAFFFDESAQRTRVCDGTITKDANGDDSCSGTIKELDDVKYLWTAAGWLSEIAPNATDTNEDIRNQRTLVADTSASNYISTTKKRFVFFWDDLDADGKVDSGEVMDFEDGTDWDGKTVATDRAPVPWDFGVQTDAEVDAIIKWVRGLDSTGNRSRELAYDFDGDGTDTTVTWRLGDVVHSTPLSVAAPAEGFQYLYRDYTYSTFVAQYKNRRHMVYYGGNDGMLHAVNAGFYSESDQKFCKTADCSGESSAPELGAELWAYVPYNLLPHLKCLMSPSYTHKYYVDQRTRIFDVRIFPDDATHPNGWGTILVGAMRFGGAKVQAAELDLDGNGSPDYPNDTREFTSAYFIFDITNPEKPPVLLGEFTRTTSASDNLADLGYSYAIPTLVTMKNGPDEDDHDWYLVLGSGPTDIDGTSTQNGKLAVIPLRPMANSADAGYPAAFRIPDALPTSTNNTGVFSLTSNSWVTDLIALDFELSANYMADAVYFGTVSGDWYDDGTSTGGWGGAMYRLVTRSVNGSNNQVETEPYQWDTLIGSSGTNPKKLIDLASLNTINADISISAGQAVTASASAGTDGKNFWIYFGTGRFLYDDDKTDTASNETNTFYGIKEPMSYTTVSGSCVGTFTWETVEYTGTQDSTPGAQGLTRVDKILVGNSTDPDAALSCSGGGTACLPDSGAVDIFSELEEWIAGTGNGCGGSSDSSGTDGWYRNMNMARERNLGQATLLGGLVTYTTFQPYSSVCQSEGLSYLYGVYYLTGTAYYEPVFITGDDDGIDDDGNIIEQVALGRGLATTPNLHVGKQEGAKAFVQTSTGTIVEVPQPNLPVKNQKTGRTSWGVVR